MSARDINPSRPDTKSHRSLKSLADEIRRLKTVARTLGEVSNSHAFVVDVFVEADGDLSLVVCGPQWADEHALGQIVASAFTAAIASQRRKEAP